MPKRAHNSLPATRVVRVYALRSHALVGIDRRAPTGLSTFGNQEDKPHRGATVHAFGESRPIFCLHADPGSALDQLPPLVPTKLALMPSRRWVA